MKHFSNNDVARRLKELSDKKSQRARDRHFQQIEWLKNPKPAIATNYLPSWKGAPTPAPVDPLYDLAFLQVIKLWTHYGLQGQAANVVVIDTGVDGSHPAFAHTQIFEKSFLPGVASAKDENGHGSWVCGKIVGQGVGVAPMCNLSAYRVLDVNGSGTVDTSIAALKVVLHDGTTNLVNISFGTPLYSAEQEEVIKQLSAAGVIVVAAAGNYGSDAPFYPGSYDSCLTVAATNKAGARGSFSDYGGQIDIAAPGVACYSTFLSGQFRALTGTSMATPVVTGLLALGVSYLKMVKKVSDRKQISILLRNALEQTANDPSNATKDPYYGFGLINGPSFFEKLAAL